MATANLSNLSNLISIEEYLNTTYRPDVDYVDGEIEERNLGEFDHADLQDIWIFDAETRIAHVCTATTMTEHKVGTLRVDGTKIEISIEEVFSTLDA